MQAFDPGPLVATTGSVAGLELDGGYLEAPDATAAASLGASLAPLTRETRQRLQLPDDTKGVVVVDIKREGAAAEAGLRPGDADWGLDPSPGVLTRQIDGQTVRTTPAPERGDYPAFYAAVRDAIRGEAAAPVSADQPEAGPEME